MRGNPPRARITLQLVRHPSDSGAVYSVTGAKGQGCAARARFHVALSMVEDGRKPTSPSHHHHQRGHIEMGRVFGVSAVTLAAIIILVLVLT